MNVYWQELRMARGGMIGWIVALLLVTALFVAIFPVFQHDIAASRELLIHFPPNIRAMFGLSLDAFATFIGFYAYTFTYVGFAGAVQAMSLGFIMLSRENITKTNEFLLTRPVTRAHLFVWKLLASCTVLVATNAALILGTVVMAMLVGAWGFSLQRFGLLALAFFILQVICLSIGLIVSQFVRVKSIVSLSLGLTSGLFVLGLLQSLTGDTLLRIMTPFQYFNHMDIAVTGCYDRPFVWLSLAVIVCALAVAYWRYRARDIRSAA